MACSTRSCSARSCTSCPGSCRRSALSTVVNLDFANAPYPLTDTAAVGLAPLTFTVNCTSNVNIQFAGTLDYAAGGEVTPPDHVITMKLQYVNAAVPSYVNPVANPLQATVTGRSGSIDDYVPFTAVQTVQLTPGTYVAQLLISSDSTTTISVSGTMSAFIVNKSA